MGRDVDFVVGDDVPASEPADEAPPARRRRPPWLILAAAAVVLVGGGLVIHGLGDGDGDTSDRAASSATPSASASRPDRDSSTALDPVRAASSPLPTPTDRLGCPPFVACRRSATVPAAATKAVRAAFAGARPVRGQTVVLQRDNTATLEVHARLLVFRAGRIEVFVRVSTPGSDDDIGAVPVNTRTVIRTAPTGQYVTVEVAAQNGVELPGYDVLQRLVGDDRLLAI